MKTARGGKKERKKGEGIKRICVNIEKHGNFFRKSSHQGQDSQGIDDNSCG